MYYQVKFGEKVRAKLETPHLCHPVIHLHRFDPLAQALCCRGSLRYYGGVKDRIRQVLSTNLLHDRNLQKGNKGQSQNKIQAQVLNN